MARVNELIRLTGARFADAVDSFTSSMSDENQDRLIYDLSVQASHWNIEAAEEWKRKASAEIDADNGT